MLEINRLLDKVAIITGSGAGIGKTIAKSFAKEGAKVVIVDFDEEALNTTVKEIQDTGREALGLKVNVTSEEDVKKMVSETLSHFGTIDILVNNAGVSDNMQAAGNVEDNVWNRVMDINVMGVMRCVRQVLPYFEKNQAGIILNMSSVAGVTGGRGGLTYTAAKHAVVGMTKNIGSQYGPLGIRCNAVAPGNIQTDFSSRMQNIDQFGMKQAIRATNLIPRAGQVEEIASICVFLASEDSSYINGQTIVADGGWSAY
ncbi:glucose 1-dehydrogenase [Jeotgalibaca sp. MA1X17-3]|uniref:glucose 1-dehydrogenase n=1 Tax=Jeotgalibaca sp. MA1X17-3 TaxID=2908211 RepID=UPI001F24D10B|nr:glucose 1-dehydrogenase [Jeotgalibaca sp. MA1X17-3]UJF16345.1 glucose 1-dehydrogenase [Jeotgalibaca sp. MA1X17-3]